METTDTFIKKRTGQIFPDIDLKMERAIEKIKGNNNPYGAVVEMSIYVRIFPDKEFIQFFDIINRNDNTIEFFIREVEIYKRSRIDGYYHILENLKLKYLTSFLDQLYDNHSKHENTAKKLFIDIYKGNYRTNIKERDDVIDAFIVSLKMREVKIHEENLEMEKMIANMQSYSLQANLNRTISAPGISTIKRRETIYANMQLLRGKIQ